MKATCSGIGPPYRSDRSAVVEKKSDLQIRTTVSSTETIEMTEYKLKPVMASWFQLDGVHAKDEELDKDWIIIHIGAVNEMRLRWSGSFLKMGLIILASDTTGLKCYTEVNLYFLSSHNSATVFLYFPPSTPGAY